MDEPHATPETGGFTTGGVVSAPIAGKVIERIAPLLAVRRIAVTQAADPKAPVDPKLLAGDE
jgi:cell division protein FtsI (penicillin-binding protein 3)